MSLSDRPAKRPAAHYWPGSRTDYDAIDREIARRVALRRQAIERATLWDRDTRLLFALSLDTFLADRSK